MRLLSTTLVAATLFVASPIAQICAPTPPPSGQPALMPFTPVCIGAVPPPIVWAVGNPGFALASFAPPPVPIGSPTVLMVGITVPPLPVPAPPLFPPFGPVGFFNQFNILAVPAGPSGPGPGPAILFPLPPTGGPLGFLLNVQTVALMPPPFVALTGAIDIII